MKRHWAFYRDFLGQAVPGGQLEIRLTDWCGLAAQLQGEEFILDPERTSGRGYYQRACFKIYLNGSRSGTAALRIGWPGC
ncbi:MAG: hypothetical protein KF760_28215 [Candidatus Eremiobacteraeota bacterium]|nr:hypothetical protein [Candidatus Eremiobacteraeota bacterium]MCW5865781.1 hypothetical protein [Candidatus Eremiobacteraeota bacterium]